MINYHFKSYRTYVIVLVINQMIGDDQKVKIGVISIIFVGLKLKCDFCKSGQERTEDQMIR